MVIIDASPAIFSTCVAKKISRDRALPSLVVPSFEAQIHRMNSKAASGFFAPRGMPMHHPPTHVEDGTFL